ncbi:MAG TPA: FtsQ-type POTRA domain-containing protein [bacterium]|nr:FtsQ-type POTRA domain-containing protein [bacterium]
MGRKKRGKRNGKRGSLGAFFKASFHFALKAIPIFIIIFAAGGAFFGLRGMLFADPHLSIQRILVAPTDALSREQRLRVDSLLAGKNILSVDIRRISGLLEKDPWIETAVVTKRLPSEISIEVRKRVPIAYVRFLANGGLALVSGDGMVLEIPPAQAVTGLVIEISGTGTKEPRVGERLSVKGFEQANQFFREFPKHPLAQFESISKISLDPIGNVKATLGKGPELRLGRKPLEVMRSFDKIAPILESSERSKIDYIDLQFNNVIVKQKK